MNDYTFYRITICRETHPVFMMSVIGERNMIAIYRAAFGILYTDPSMNERSIENCTGESLLLSPEGTWVPYTKVVDGKTLTIDDLLFNLEFDECPTQEAPISLMSFVLAPAPF